jgi:hypothetical protein
LDLPPGSGDIRVSQLARQVRGGRHLDVQAQFEDLVKVVVGENGNAESAVPDDLHQTLACQIEERFSDGGRGYTQAFGNTPDGVQLPGPHLARFDIGPNRARGASPKI